MQLKKLYSNICKNQLNLESSIGKLESELQKYVTFDFSIFYQYSDGFVIVDDDANNAALGACLGWIETHGTLTHASYLKLTL